MDIGLNQTRNTLRPCFSAQGEYNPLDHTSLILQWRPMKDKAFKPHERFRAQLHLKADCPAGFQRVSNACLEVTTHRSAAVVREELEDIYANVWGAVVPRLDWEEQFRNSL